MGNDVLMTVGGTPFITREEFNKSLSEPGAPQDYSYDQYVADSTETANEAYERKKNEWRDANPGATWQEYESAIKRIADECGVCICRRHSK